MKKLLLYLYTFFRVAYLPAVFAVPMLTMQPYGLHGWRMDFLGFYILVPYLALELVLRHYYRKFFAQFSIRFWVISGVISWLLTVGLLCSVLPGMPLHKQSLNSVIPNNPQNLGVVLETIVTGTTVMAAMTFYPIMDRRSTFALYKKSDLFK